MKKRALSLILACFMVVSTFIISRPVVDVHAVEYYENFNQWTLPTDWSTGLKNDNPGAALYTRDYGFDYAERADGRWKFAFYTNVDKAIAHVAASNVSAQDIATGASGSGVGPSPFMCTSNNRWLVAGNKNVDWFYVNPTGRWSGTASIHGKKSLNYINFSHNNKGYVPAVVFVAPEDGIYSYSSLVTAITIHSGAKLTATVRKNGEVLASFSPAAVGDSKNFEGEVSLLKGEELAFVFSQDVNNFVTYKAVDQGDAQFRISSTVVKKVGQLTTSPKYELVLNNFGNSTDTDANGWSTTRQGAWFLTHANNLGGTASTTLRSAWNGSGAPTTCPRPWLEGGKNVTKTGFYINPENRWGGVTIFHQNAGVTDHIQVIPSKSYSPALVFTAPLNGVYDFSTTFNGKDYYENSTKKTFTGMVDANGNPVEVLATVSANGEVLDSVTIKDGNLNGSFTGKANLKAGDQLVFTFKLTSNATINNHDSFLLLTSASAQKVANLPADYTADTELPIIFDGTSRFDVLGNVELVGYNRDVEGTIEDKIYRQGIEVKSTGSTWYLTDGCSGEELWIITKTNFIQTSYKFEAPANTIMNAGGHHYKGGVNYPGIGSAAIFTAPYTGKFEIEFYHNSNWTGAKKAGVDIFIMNENNEILDITSATTDRAAMTVNAVVELTKGEKVYIVRAPQKLGDENVSGDGNSKLTITALDHNCSADTVKYYPATPPTCGNGYIEHWACPCGTNYADADITVELYGPTVIPGSGHFVSDNYEITETTHGALCGGGCGQVLSVLPHTWFDGKCSVCGYACKHEGEISTPNCMFPGICSVCKDGVLPINPDKHVLENTDTAYYANGNGTHKVVTVCCKSELVADENCTFGTDNVCDKCGFESASHSEVEDAFDNIFNGGNNDVTVTGPSSDLKDYITKVEGTDVPGVTYAQFNLHHVNGKVTLRHHFVIAEGTTYSITINGKAVTLTNVEGTNIWYVDVTPELGKYDVADKISVNGTVTYNVSLYTYIRKALASNEVKDVEKTYLKALYDLNEEAKTAATEKPVYVALANQRGDMGTPARPSKNWIDIYDITAGNMNTPYKSYSVTAGAISGFKFRESEKFGKVLLIGGSYDAEIISMETGESLWLTKKASQNVHSIELLPNGVLVTAASAGSALDFFNTNLPVDHAVNTAPLHIELADGHGVLWDPENNVLWALGRTHLWAFNVTLNDDGTITATKNETFSVEMPMDHGHDLQPFYGNNDYLIVTGKTVMLFNKKTKQFTEMFYEGSSIKGVGILPNGDFVYIYPDGLHETWNSTWINVIDSATGEVTHLHSNQGRFYKLRVLNYDYQ